MVFSLNPPFLFHLGDFGWVPKSVPNTMESLYESIRSLLDLPTKKSNHRKYWTVTVFDSLALVHYTDYVPGLLYSALSGVENRDGLSVADLRRILQHRGTIVSVKDRSVVSLTPGYNPVVVTNDLSSLPDGTTFVDASISGVVLRCFDFEGKRYVASHREIYEGMRVTTPSEFNKACASVTVDPAFASPNTHRFFYNGSLLYLGSYDRSLKKVECETSPTSAPAQKVLTKEEAQELLRRDDLNLPRINGVSLMAFIPGSDYESVRLSGPAHFFSQAVVRSGWKSKDVARRVGEIHKICSKMTRSPGKGPNEEDPFAPRVLTPNTDPMQFYVDLCKLDYQDLFDRVHESMVHPSDVKEYGMRFAKGLTLYCILNPESGSSGIKAFQNERRAVVHGIIADWKSIPANQNDDMSFVQRRVCEIKKMSFPVGGNTLSTQDWHKKRLENLIDVVSCEYGDSLHLIYKTFYSGA